jgi:DNA helicase-2/ATP-dependent DNA helicase PcrA
MVNTTERVKEERYLATVYQELLQTAAELDTLLQQAKTEGISTLQMMSSELSLNFDNITDNLDTYAAIESKNREIDQMNHRIDNAAIIRRKVNSLLKTPYFGKITVDFKDGTPPENLYIGVSNFTNHRQETRIYDWRSSIAELFYNNDLGASSYSVNHQIIPVNLTARRQLLVEKDQLLQFFDTNVAIADDVLLATLAKDSTAKMQDITATIQKEQNVIIRKIQEPVILVNGVAGSGKTSTIMQRIAYLLYSLREQITVDDVLILSPNNQFITYLENVLPALGEQNPLNLTFRQWLMRVLPVELESEATYFERISQPVEMQQDQVLRSTAFVHFLRKVALTHTLSEDSFCEVTRKNRVIFSQAKLQTIFETTPTKTLLDRLQATKLRLVSEWQKRLIQQSRSARLQEQVLNLTENEQLHYFGKVLAADAELQIEHYTLQLLQKRYRTVTRQLDQMNWLNLDHLFQKLYQEYTGKRYVAKREALKTVDEATILLLIRQLFVEKSQQASFQYILIDEVQDYTPAQIELLTIVYPKSKFTLVGDESQAIFQTNLSFHTLTTLFEKNQRKVSLYELNNSYRSSGAITKIFRALATSKRPLTIVPVRPDGRSVVFQQCGDEQAFLIFAKKYLAEYAIKQLTIITKTKAEADHLVTKFETLSQVVILPLSLAKGLEFDHVLLYEVSPENYKTKRDQRMLYTAVSRAMQTLAITYSTKKSALLGS